MKTTTTIILASFFAVATATAQPMTSNEIFSAIDGEYNHAEESMKRVNFDAPTRNSTNLLNQVLSGVDGEYSYVSNSTFRINYLTTSFQPDSFNVLDEVLSGVDGEYNQ